MEPCELYNTTAPIPSTVPRGRLKTDRNKRGHPATTSSTEMPKILGLSTNKGTQREMHRRQLRKCAADAYGP